MSEVNSGERRIDEGGTVEAGAFEERPLERRAGEVAVTQIGIEEVFARQTGSGRGRGTQISGLTLQESAVVAHRTRFAQSTGREVVLTPDRQSPSPTPSTDSGRGRLAMIELTTPPSTTSWWPFT